jgi:hypothetical protein
MGKPELAPSTPDAAKGWPVLTRLNTGRCGLGHPPLVYTRYIIFVFLSIGRHFAPQPRSYVAGRPFSVTSGQIGFSAHQSPQPPWHTPGYILCVSLLSLMVRASVGPCGISTPPASPSAFTTWSAAAKRPDALSSSGRWHALLRRTLRPWRQVCPRPLGANSRQGMPSAWRM